MTLQNIESQYREAEVAFHSFLRNTPEAKLVQAPEGKWSSLGHLAHINKSVAPLVRYFSSPKEALRARLGSYSEAPRNYEAIYAAYQERLKISVVANDAYVPEENPLLEEETAKLQALTNGLFSALNHWSEEELDAFPIPHPLLGMMSAREMLFFSILHLKHHHASAKRMAGEMD